MHKKYIILLLFCLGVVFTDIAAEPITVFMKKEVLTDTRMCLVTKYHLITPPDHGIESYKLLYKFGENPDIKYFGSDITYGIHNNEAINLLFVAQITTETSKHPAMLMLSINNDSYSVPLNNDMSLKEAIELYDIQGGITLSEYTLLGRLGADPIFLYLATDHEEQPQHQAMVKVTKGITSKLSNLTPVVSGDDLVIPNFVKSVDGFDYHQIKIVHSWKSNSPTETIHQVKFDGKKPVDVFSDDQLDIRLLPGKN